MNQRFASAVAGFGLLLRSSHYKGTASWSNVLYIAQNARGNDLKGYRAEFVEMIQKARRLS